jgi:hypothetical protein
VKNVLLIVCALGYGFLPAAAGFETPWMLLIPVLLGLIYFVFYRHDFGGRLLPWLLACAAVGRVAAYGWLNLRHGREGPLLDQEGWIFGGLAAVCFAFMLWNWIRHHNESSASASPKST